MKPDPHADYERYRQALETIQQWEYDYDELEALAARLADVLRQMIPGTHYRRKMRGEVLKAWDGFCEKERTDG